MESLATLDLNLDDYVSNCSRGNCTDYRLINLTDADLINYIVQKLGHKKKDLFSSFSLTCIYVVIFVTGVVGNLSTCFVIRRNKYMHTTINLYLFSLAIADLLIIVLGKWFFLYILFWFIIIHVYEVLILSISFKYDVNTLEQLDSYRQFHKGHAIFIEKSCYYWIVS